MTENSITSLFSSAGTLAGLLHPYEERSGQIRMAAAVADVLETGGSLMVEAGTGIGKSLAYLIPLLSRVTDERRGVVSTHTIALQQQLLAADIPVALDTLGTEVKVALLLGRGNYLCLRKLHRQQLLGLFADADAAGRQRTLFARAKNLKRGERSELDFAFPEAEWRLVASSPDACAGSRCPFVNECFFQRARRRAQSADLVITNHALLLADVILRSSGEAVLPDYAYLVVDEAHRLEDAATDQLGYRASQGRLRGLVGELYSPVRRTGGLAGAVMDRAVDGDELAEHFSKILDAAVGHFASLHAGLGPGREREERILRDLLSVGAELDAELGRTAGWLTQLADGAAEDDALELGGAARLLDGYRSDLTGLEERRWEGFVYWADGLHDAARLRLHAAPVEVGPKLESGLWSLPEAVVATSATLTVGGDFSYLSTRLGFPPGEELLLPPAFDFATQAALYLPRLPDPRDRGHFTEAVAEIRRLVELNRVGGTLVLFTSHEALRAFKSGLEEDLRGMGCEVLAQGDSDRTRLLRDFKEARRGVLFATATFWEGVDLPGNELRLLVIARLPFAVPTDPVVTARSEAIEKRGGRPFDSYSVPEAALRLRQGFGRLVRKKTDRGVVAVLDSRILTKAYGAVMLAGLPPARRFLSFQADALGEYLAGP
ncbi:MAG: DEAD/DEAH box helicase [bacterium]|nr:DEAD/DEAH box helicase [bacterium]